MTITLSQITKFLERYHRRALHKPELTRAAVLMLFFSVNEQLHVLLTKRTEDVEHHKGQISFPGGAHDEEDEDDIATALRECHEEIGLAPESVQILGTFDDVETPTGFVITPVVAYAHSLPPLHPSQSEVAEIIEAPVSLFLDKRAERIEQRQRFGVTIDVYFFRFGEHEIWGATAAILRAFLHAVRDFEVDLSE